MFIWLHSKGSLVVNYTLNIKKEGVTIGKIADEDISHAAGYIKHFLDKNDNTLDVGNVTTTVDDITAVIDGEEGTSNT